ncbi:MAG: flagellar assembly protein FliW [Bryobacteraceae bacterium]
MPFLATKYFGLMEYDTSATVDFPFGIPAFENERQFLLIEQASMAPLLFLQSLTHADLCFLTLPVLNLEPSYQLEILHDDIRALGLDDSRQPRIGDEILCLALIAAAENCPATANLWAPLVINRAARKGLQAIRPDSVYSPRHGVEPRPQGSEPCL